MQRETAMTDSGSDNKVKPMTLGGAADILANIEAEHRERGSLAGGSDNLRDAGWRNHLEVTWTPKLADRSSFDAGWDARDSEVERRVAAAIREHTQTIMDTIREETVQAIADAEVRGYQRQLDERLARALEAKAEAWDEGAARVVNFNKAAKLVTPTDNPYRALASGQEGK